RFPRALSACADREARQFRPLSDAGDAGCLCHTHGGVHRSERDGEALIRRAGGGRFSGVTLRELPLLRRVAQQSLLACGAWLVVNLVPCRRVPARSVLRACDNLVLGHGAYSDLVVNGFAL